VGRSRRSRKMKWFILVDGGDGEAE
jgi:hypothetical protein